MPLLTGRKCSTFRQRKLIKIFVLILNAFESHKPNNQTKAMTKRIGYSSTHHNCQSVTILLSNWVVNIGCFMISMPLWSCFLLPHYGEKNYQAILITLGKAQAPLNQTGSTKRKQQKENMKTFFWEKELISHLKLPRVKVLRAEQGLQVSFSSSFCHYLFSFFFVFRNAHITQMTQFQQRKIQRPMLCYAMLECRG